MGSRLAARMAGNMPLTMPTSARIVIAITDVGRDDQPDIASVRVLGHRAVEGRVPTEKETR